VAVKGSTDAVRRDPGVRFAGPPDDFGGDVAARPGQCCRWPSLASFRMSGVEVVELRQYLLHPGRRDELIEIFERELFDPQEQAGMPILGTFRDLDRPDHFVWLRGFPDVASRAPALEAFYGGPVWAAHGGAAAATMIDSDDVLLLRPAAPGFGLPPRVEPGDGGVVTIEVYPLATPLTGPARAAFRTALLPAVAVLETEPAPTDFPALPVREGEHVVVRVARDGDGPAPLDPVPAGRLAGPPQRLRLEPTQRSRLR